MRSIAGASSLPMFSTSDDLARTHKEIFLKKTNSLFSRTITFIRGKKQPDALLPFFSNELLLHIFSYIPLFSLGKIRQVNQLGKHYADFFHPEVLRCAKFLQLSIESHENRTYVKVANVLNQFIKQIISSEKDVEDCEKAKLYHAMFSTHQYWDFRQIQAISNDMKKEIGLDCLHSLLYAYLASLKLSALGLKDFSKQIEKFTNLLNRCYCSPNSVFVQLLKHLLNSSFAIAFKTITLSTSLNQQEKELFFSALIFSCFLYKQEKQLNLYLDEGSKYFPKQRIETLCEQIKLCQ